MAQLLLALLADIVFKSAAGSRRGFGRDMDRYLQQRGLVSPPVPRELPAR